MIYNFNPFLAITANFTVVFLQLRNQGRKFENIKYFSLA